MVGTNLKGWLGTQVPVLQPPHGHHPDERGAVDEPDIIVRFLPPSTLRVALNDGGY
jgi:hypothetical protein